MELSVFQTLGIFQDAFRFQTKSDGEAARKILAGELDAELKKLILFWNRQSGLPTSEALTDAKLKEIKERLALKVGQLASAFVEQVAQRQLEATILESKRNQQPHILGTVDEISKRHNISKSHIRRLKAQGGTALQDYLNTLYRTA